MWIRARWIRRLIRPSVLVSPMVEFQRRAPDWTGSGKEEKLERGCLNTGEGSARQSRAERIKTGLERACLHGSVDGHLDDPFAARR